MPQISDAAGQDPRRADPSLCDQLLRLQIALSASAAPAADALMQRALLLFRLGQMSHALRDLERALALDPADPQAMGFYCRISAGLRPAAARHAMATALLSSPFADMQQRHLALSALDPALLPLLLRTAQPKTERLTLLQGPGDLLQITGTGPQDVPQPLGRDAASGVSALDYHLARPGAGSAPRRLGVRLNDQSCAVDIDAADAPTAPRGSQMPAEAARLWIILPLKDGGAVLERCLASVMVNLQDLHGARLLLVDDGSERPETRALLRKMAQSPRIRVIRSPGGLGFTGAVNLGLRHIGTGPVLLLNSDTWLPRHTLTRMLAHLRDPEVGTVTPLSNNAGSLCLLGPGQAAAMPPDIISTRLAQAAHRLQPGLAVDLPNGNGFAMLISDPCLRAIGPLSGLYESGYYEEVDFCLRAGLRGWRHVAACDCFIAHVGSVTYGAQKQRLVAQNRRRLMQRFPGYQMQYARFAALDPLAGPRGRILAALEPHWRPEPLADPARQALDRIGHAVLALPSAPDDAPLLLPCIGEIPDRWAATADSLHLVPQAQLQSMGLRLRPAHGLIARFDAAAGQLLIGAESGGAALFALACPAGAAAPAPQALKVLARAIRQRIAAPKAERTAHADAI